MCVNFGLNIVHKLNAVFWVLSDFDFRFTDYLDKTRVKMHQQARHSV